MEPNTIDWRALLVREVGNNKRGKAGVADELGVSRAYVSRAMSDGKAAFEDIPQALIDRVIARYHVIAECPITNATRPRSDCQRIGNGPAPTHNPLAMQTWRTCQNCAHKPPKENA